MPNRNTFRVKPIRELISNYLNGGIWIDPFARDSIFKEKCTFTNDLNPNFKNTHNLEALEFLKLMDDESCDGILFDPPYSSRQLKECYADIGRDVFSEDTNGSFYSRKKDEIARIIRPGGVCISFCWNSSGMGMKRGFKIVEVMLVCHGSHINDTIVTVERKLDAVDLL